MRLSLNGTGPARVKLFLLTILIFTVGRKFILEECQRIIIAMNHAHVSHHIHNLEALKSYAVVVKSTMTDDRVQYALNSHVLFICV